MGRRFSPSYWAERLALWQSISWEISLRSWEVGCRQVIAVWYVLRRLTQWDYRVYPLSKCLWIMYWCASPSKRENAEPRSGLCPQEVHSPVREQVPFQHPPQNNAQAKSGKALGKRLRNGRLWHQSPEHGVYKVRSSPHQLLGKKWVPAGSSKQRTSKRRSRSCLRLRRW